MSKDNSKNITVNISEQCWIELKVLSVRRKVGSVATIVQEMIEKAVEKKYVVKDKEVTTEV